MTRSKRTRAGLTVALLSTALAGTGLGVAPARAADGDLVWRPLRQTVNLSWTDVAAVCPTDGASPCTGAVGGVELSGWIWATAAQVRAEMVKYAPSLGGLSSVTGNDLYAPANGFISAFAGPTGTFVTEFSYAAWVAGFTATASGPTAIEGRVGTTQPESVGAFSLTSAPRTALRTRGVFLFKPAGSDLTPPEIVPTVNGTRGANGWYLDDVEVSWSVSDPETVILAKSGCDAITISNDTRSQLVKCTATSGGGTASRQVVIRRDTTPPTITCPNPVPQFIRGQAGATVVATATDATSGLPAQRLVARANVEQLRRLNATFVARDTASNVRRAFCPYEVVSPLCAGRRATIVGTSGNDTINGTTGNDVIVSLGGNDVISAKAGNDVVCSGDGNDTLSGGLGNDFLDGGAGDDRANGGPGANRCLGVEIRQLCRPL